MRMEDMMSNSIQVLHPGDTFRKAAGVFRVSRLPGLPVVDDDGRLVGLLTRSNFLDAVLKEHPLDAPIEGLYIRDVLNVTTGDRSFDEVVDIARHSPAGLGVVVDDGGKVKGLFTKVDLIMALLKQKDLAERLRSMDNQITYYRKELKKMQERQCIYDFDDIIALSRPMQALKREAALAARGRSNVILTGESGTGKELFAHAVHRASARRDKPFIKVNCSAVPDSLLESEFFGYSPGAFTGAQKGGKPGRFEMADGGTLFLDEIGDMPVPLQAKLLRVFQDRSFERVGGTSTIHVDVRIITATNQDLGQKVREGAFRADLYYRLNVIQLSIPPLRERREDILPLAHSFIKKYNRILGANIEGLSDEVALLLQTYTWPGNVRELENTIERAMNFSFRGAIEKRCLPRQVIQAGQEKAEQEPPAARALPEKNTPYRNCVDDAEREAIITALQSVGGNKARAARVLGISRSWLYEKIKRLNIQ